MSHTFPIPLGEIESEHLDPRRGPRALTSGCLLVLLEIAVGLLAHLFWQ